MGTNYPQQTISTNLGLSLIGMDEVIADDMVIIDNAFGNIHGTILQTNGVPNTLQTVLNLIAGANITLVPNSFGGVTLSSSATVGSAWSSLTGALSNGQVIPYADAGISRLSPNSLAIGNSVAGDFSGNLKLAAGTFVNSGNTNENISINPPTATGTITFGPNPATTNTYIFGDSNDQLNLGAAARMFLEVGGNAVAYLTSSLFNLSGGTPPVLGWGTASNTAAVGLSYINTNQLALGNGGQGDRTGTFYCGAVELTAHTPTDLVPLTGVGSITPTPNTSGGLLLTSYANFSSVSPFIANVQVSLWIAPQNDFDTYLVLQGGAGSGASQRDYVCFMDYDGSVKWLTGKNGHGGTFPNQFILYDSITDIHRMVLSANSDGVSGGPTFLAGAGAFPVIINGNEGLSDRSCTGGFQVWGGGTTGANAVFRFAVTDAGVVQVGAVDTGISRLGAASLALGNGTAGDVTGSLTLASLVLSAPSTKSSAGSAGVAGQLAYDATKLYLCTVSGVAGAATWKAVTMTAV